MLGRRAPIWVFPIFVIMFLITLLAIYVNYMAVAAVICVTEIVFVAIIDIYYTAPPLTTIREIYDKLQHKCASLRNNPALAALPRDILHNYITPMVNNIDGRTVFISDRCCFANASVQYSDGDPFAPLGLRVRGPIPVPTPNPVDDDYKLLQTKGVIESDYLGGMLFVARNQIYHLRDRELHQLPINNIERILIIRRVVVVKHNSGYTFLSPTNLKSIKVESEQLPEIDRQFLATQFK